jgi:hypothetical protein
VLTSTVDSLCGDLEGILVDRGLYPDEAHAMVATWRDSCFEEGSLLISILPRGFIDNVLPLAIDPAPAQIVRVFVRRLEIVTCATASAVETAVESDDEGTRNKYGRFLKTILRTVREKYPGVSPSKPTGSMTRAAQQARGPKSSGHSWGLSPFFATWFPSRVPRLHPLEREPMGAQQRLAPKRGYLPGPGQTVPSNKRQNSQHRRHQEISETHCLQSRPDSSHLSCRR